MLVEGRAASTCGCIMVGGAVRVLSLNGYESPSDAGVRSGRVRSTTRESLPRATSH